MVQSFKIPWGAWYGDQDLALEFPDSWDVQLFKMQDGKPITQQKKIKTALDNPIGTPPISNIAKGKQNAVIVIDDISRPNKMDSILVVVLNDLEQAGISRDKVTIIFAIGAHRPMGW